MNRSNLKVLALVPNLLGHAPGQRSSIEIWAPHLEKMGIAVTFYPFETSALHEVLYEPGHVQAKAINIGRAYARYLRHIPAVKGFDVVYIYREAALIGPSLIERIPGLLKRPLVYELDDPIFVPTVSPFQGRFSVLKFPGKVRGICRRSTTVIVNSAPLHAWARQYCGNVVKIPSSVYVAPLRANYRRSSKKNVIGWSGSPSTQENLRLIADPLSAAQYRTNAEVVFFGVRNFQLAGVRHTSEPWSQDREASVIGEFSVGLVPMPDNEWNHWKFSLKAAQYMAAGVPVIASPVGDLVNQVVHGVNGYLAATNDEWSEAISRVLNDSKLRQCMSVAANTQATSLYNAEKTARMAADVFVEAHFRMR